MFDVGWWCLTGEEAELAMELEQKRLAQKDYNLRWRYNISLEEYTLKFEAQERRCAGCNKEWNGRMMFDVDCDPETGQFKRLLCRRCSTRKPRKFTTAQMLFKPRTELKPEPVCIVQQEWEDA